MRLLFAIAFLALALPTANLASAADKQVPGVQRSSNVPRTARTARTPRAVCSHSNDQNACCQAACDGGINNQCFCKCVGGIWHQESNRGPICE